MQAYLIVSDHQSCGVVTLQAIDGCRHIPQRINVQTRVNLIQNCQICLQVSAGRLNTRPGLYKKQFLWRTFCGPSSNQAGR